MQPRNLFPDEPVLRVMSEKEAKKRKKRPHRQQWIDTMPPDEADENTVNDPPDVGPQIEPERENAEQQGQGHGAIYCVRCKKKTKSQNAKKVKTKNGKNMIKCQCAACGGNKSCFCKSQKGGFF